MLKCSICKSTTHTSSRLHLKEQFIILLLIPFYSVMIPLSIIITLSPLFYVIYQYTKGAVWTSFFLSTYIAGAISSTIVIKMEFRRLLVSQPNTLSWMEGLIELFAIFSLSIVAFFFFWPKVFLSAIQMGIRQYQIERERWGLKKII